jgi:hypothetical protein
MLVNLLSRRTLLDGKTQSDRGLQVPKTIEMLLDYNKKIPSSWISTVQSKYVQ